MQAILAEKRRKLLEGGVAIQQQFRNEIDPALLERFSETERVRNYPDPLVFHAFLFQVSGDDSSCANAVAQVQQWAARENLPVPSSSTASYCEARAALPIEMLQAVHRSLCQQLDANLPEASRWRGLRPLVEDGAGFAVDFGRLAQAVLEGGARLVFLCSPGNPTGNALALGDVAALANRLRGRALVVVDEAYGEFSAMPSATALLEDHENIAVLRTLSKAHALAGARIGVGIANAALVGVLRSCQAPYPVPAPCTEVALAALHPEALAHTAENIGQLLGERARVAGELAELPGVKRVYPSQGNFLLVRFDDAGVAYDRLLAAGIVVRDQRSAPGLGDALRITIGTPEQNERVLQVLQGHVQEQT